MLVYLLLEHKSYIDRYIALQLLGYVLKIQEWRKRNGQPPCVVIPIVIYHGDEPWDEPTSLRDKISAGEHLTAFVPDMQVILADLSRLSAESLPDIPELEARIRTLQKVLRQPVASQEELMTLSPEELQLRAQQLQGLVDEHSA